MDDATRKLNGYVQDVRKDPAVRGNYMTLGEKIDREKLKSLNEGIEIGKGEGKTDQLAEMICKKLRKGKTLSEIADDLEADEAEIKPVYDIAVEFAPDYALEAVLEGIRKAATKELTTVEG